MLSERAINNLVDDFVEVTSGLVSEGFTSLEVAGGDYELHMKPYHLATAGGMNIYNAEELKTYKYKYLTLDEINDMVDLNEFPVSLRTIHKGEEGTQLLIDTGAYLVDVPTPEHIRDVILFDMDTLGVETYENV